MGFSSSLLEQASLIVASIWYLMKFEVKTLMVVSSRVHPLPLKQVWHSLHPTVLIACETTILTSLQKAVGLVAPSLSELWSTWSQVRIITQNNQFFRPRFVTAEIPSLRVWANFYPSASSFTDWLQERFPHLVRWSLVCVCLDKEAGAMTKHCLLQSTFSCQLCFGCLRGWETAVCVQGVTVWQPTPAMSSFLHVLLLLLS